MYIPGNSRSQTVSDAFSYDRVHSYGQVSFPSFHARTSAISSYPCSSLYKSRQDILQNLVYPDVDYSRSEPVGQLVYQVWRRSKMILRCVMEQPWELMAFVLEWREALTYQKRNYASLQDSNVCFYNAQSLEDRRYYSIKFQFWLVMETLQWLKEFTSSWNRSITASWLLCKNVGALFCQCTMR